MLDELKNIDCLDGYLIRIATILQLANLQRDPLKVSKDEIDMPPKDMFYRIRRMFEEEYSPLYRPTPLSEEDIIKEYKEAFLAVFDDLGTATEILAGLMGLYDDWLAKVQILTQYLLDNPGVKDVGVYDLAGALYFIEE